MKFNRLTLLNAVDEALEAGKQRHEQRVKEWEAAQVTHRAEWVETYNPLWKDAVTRITRKLRKGDPVTLSDLPTGGFLKPHVFTVEDYRIGHLNNPGGYAANVDLAALRTTLALIEDEFVTTTALSTFGLPGSVMRRCIDQITAAKKAAEAKE